MTFKGIPPYEAGQRVRYIGSLATVERGEEGTVVFITKSTLPSCKPSYTLVGVCWNKEKRMRHSCDGKCEEQHGWNVKLDDLEVI